MRVTLLLASIVAAASLAANPAHACKGNTEIFNIDFNDEGSLGESDEYRTLTYSDGKLVLKAAKGKIAWPETDDTYSDDIDICVTVKLLKLTEKGSVGAGIKFWSLSGDTWVFLLDPIAATAKIARSQKKWTFPVNNKKVDIVKGPDHESSLRLTVQGKDLTAYVNDKQVFTYKRKDDAPDDFSVGIAAEGGEWEFSEFKATSVD